MNKLAGSLFEQVRYVFWGTFCTALTAYSVLPCPFFLLFDRQFFDMLFAARYAWKGSVGLFLFLLYSKSMFPDFMRKHFSLLSVGKRVDGLFFFLRNEDSSNCLTEARAYPRARMLAIFSFSCSMAILEGNEKKRERGKWLDKSLCSDWPFHCERVLE